MLAPTATSQTFSSLKHRQAVRLQNTPCPQRPLVRVAFLAATSPATAAVLPLTRRGRLELGLLLGVRRAEDFRRGLLPTLYLALKGKQVLNILLFQGACRTA